MTTLALVPPVKASSREPFGTAHNCPRYVAQARTCTARVLQKGLPQAVAKQAEAWAQEGPKGAAPGRPQGLPPFIYFLQDPPYGLITISVHFLRLVGLLCLGPCMALFIHAFLGYYDRRWFHIVMVP